MAIYLAIHPNVNTHIATVWDIDDKIAKRVDSKQQECAVLSPWPNLAIEYHDNWKFVPLKLFPGEYYSRIARSSNSHMHQSPGISPDTRPLQNLIEVSTGQLVALKVQLERICRVVHPTASTLNVFGHDIRNLLILAATEVESHWKGVLTANGARAENTHDYVKLSDALQLPSYEITFPHYPWMDPVRPFANWKLSPSPTKDLAWYDAYNAVKHDREQNFPLATLQSAFHAICANFVMLCAQFGMPGYWATRSELRSFFELSVTPVWDPSEVYCRPVDGADFKPVNYPFKR